MILSINLAKKNDLIRLQSKGVAPNTELSGYFEKCKATGMNLLNTSMWNNQDVMTSSGYTIEMIKEPLYLLAQCLKDGMKSN